MEALWNLQIPKSTKYKLVIRPTGDMFVTGMSKSYDEQCYDKEMMSSYLSEDDFRYVIANANLAILQFWPCYLAYFLGYFGAFFSFGLSLLLPNLCIGEARTNL